MNLKAQLIGSGLKPNVKIVLKDNKEIREYRAAIKRGEKILAERRAKKAEQKKAS
jgi:hypothetical protein